MDPRAFRECLGHFVTGVTVVTCDGDGSPHGATVNAFNSVSLDPPLVLVALDRRSRIGKYIENGAAFTVNMLEQPQGDLALHFAGRRRSEDPEWERPYPELAPQLAGSLATLSCTSWADYDGGDHVLFLGQVQHFSCRRGEPLVFYRGAFRHLGPAFEQVPWLESGDSPGISWFSTQTQPVRP